MITDLESILKQEYYGDDSEALFGFTWGTKK